MTSIVQISLKELIPGTKAGINSRQADAPIDGLVKSIATHGLLVPLLIHRINGAVYVMDGNRRLAALQKLHAKDKDAFQVPCIDHGIDPNSSVNALEVSMVANVDREGLHPVDRFEVFDAMVKAGHTVDQIAKHYSMKVVQVRQALALARMAPEVRDAWRAGQLDADVAEAFTVTSDHKAQAATLKKAGKHPDAWNVKRALIGGRDEDIKPLLAFIGRAAYEKAGHQINQSLFSDEERNLETVSDLPALIRMANEKLVTCCSSLVEDGWRWALPKNDAPNDHYAWKRFYGPSFTKDQMAGLGCFVSIGNGGEVVVGKGYIKPGDKVSVSQSPKQKKVAKEQREQRKEESGGLSNALAFRLSKQLTIAVREAFAKGVAGNDVVSFTIAALAASTKDGPMHLSIDTPAAVMDFDFVKYYKLAASKTVGERHELLASWIASCINLESHSAAAFQARLRPGKDDSKATKVLVENITPAKMKEAMQKYFDAEDYFNSVSKDMVVEAVLDSLGKEQASKVAKMKSGEAKEYAIKHVPKTGWLPEPLMLK